MSTLPDGPQLPRWWQLIQWIANPFGYLDQCRQRYGDTFTIRLSGLEPFVFLSHPQAIQAIFTAAPSQFDSGRGNAIIQPLVGDNSLMTLDGNRHRQQRKLLLPPFHLSSRQETLETRDETCDINAWGNPRRRALAECRASN
ncbi:MAG: cytochrome P450 [Symploca sp. SIO2E9]|nr:cytochrome P450 [Symploca sp. SIO2E9]